MTTDQIYLVLLIALCVLLIALAVYQHEKNQKFGGQLIDHNRRLYELGNENSNTFKLYRVELEKLEDLAHQEYGLKEQIEAMEEKIKKLERQPRSLKGDK